MTAMTMPENCEAILFNKAMITSRRAILTPNQVNSIDKVNILVIRVDENVLNKTKFPADDITSMDMFRAAQRAGAFDFWDNPAEDIYKK